MQNFGPTVVATEQSPDNLIYDTHPAIDRPMMVAQGEVIARGDLVVLDKNAVRVDNVQVGEDNVGDAEIEVIDGEGDNTLETITITYNVANDGTWTVEGSVSGVINAGYVTGTVKEDYGSFLLTITATETTPGDVFTFDIVAAGSVEATKAGAGSITDDMSGRAAIAAVAVDATDEPVPSFCYVEGVFNQNAIGNFAVVEPSFDDQDDLISALGKQGIHLKEGLK